MGYIRHHAIVVTGTYEDWIQKANKEAKRIFGEQVTNVTPEAINGTQSFLVAPDGSKEGWDESMVGDAKRKEFIGWLVSQAYEDGSSPLAWAELQYGDDNLQTEICDSSDDRYKHFPA